MKIWRQLIQDSSKITRRNKNREKYSWTRHISQRCDCGCLWDSEKSPLAGIKRIYSRFQSGMQTIYHEWSELIGWRSVRRDIALQIAAVDVVFIEQRHVLTVVDYFTQICRTKILQSKEDDEIREALIDMFRERGMPAKLITNNGREFTSDIVSPKKVSYIIQLL